MKDLPADNGTTGSVIPLTGSKTTIDTRRLELYQRVRNVHERHLDATALPAIWEELQDTFPQVWLCALEILELLESDRIFEATAAAILAWLDEKTAREAALSKLIEDGLEVMHRPGIEILTR